VRLSKLRGAKVRGGDAEHCSEIGQNQQKWHNTFWEWTQTGYPNRHRSMKRKGGEI